MLYILFSNTARRSPCPQWLVFSILAALFSLARPSLAQSPQTLNAGAVIHITVAGAPDLSGDYTVDAAGDIQMLYINQVHVLGLTPDQASTQIASQKCLGKYYRDPQVLVTLVNLGGIAVEVTGAVASQGTRLLRPDTGLNEVLQQAGPALDADLTGVQITHGMPGTTHVTDHVDYLAFLNSQATAANPLLHDGDVIYVPRKESVQIAVNVRGEVARAGLASVPAKTTVYDILQSAGGLLPDADRGGIILERASTGDQVHFDFEAAARQPDNARVNPVLLDGDIVTVRAADTSNLYTITGAVRQPGEYPLTRPNFTLADAIGKAGGTAERPKLKELTIIRTPPGGHAQVLKMDASDPTVQGSFLLHAGDNITIPQGSAGTHLDPLTALGVFGTLSRLFGHL